MVSPMGKLMWRVSFRDVFLVEECSNLLRWKQRTRGRRCTDNCFTLSCPFSHTSQKNFSLLPNRSARVNRSKHPPSVPLFPPCIPALPLADWRWGDAERDMRFPFLLVAAADLVR